MMKILRSVLLLLVSNVFMTAAWYGHLKFKNLTMWQAVLLGWGLAFFEYTFQVPANRLGYGPMTAYQLKILQEAITLMVFAWGYLGERMNLRYGISFALMFCAVWVAFGGR